MPRHTFAGKGAEAIKEAKAWAKENLTGLYYLTDSKGERIKYKISNVAIDKYTSPTATGKSDNLGVHLAVLKKLPEVIEKSIEAEVHADWPRNRDGNRDSSLVAGKDKLVHRFYGAVEIEGQIYRVKSTIQEKKGTGNKPHSYEVTEIELVGSKEPTNLRRIDPLKSTIHDAKIENNSDIRKLSAKKCLKERKREGYGKFL